MGRPFDKPRHAAPHALLLEPRGARGFRLWLDASRLAAGLYWVERTLVKPILEEDEAVVPGRDRQVLLHLRKQLAGRVATSLERPTGRRALVLGFGGPELVLRLQNTPALTLVVDGAALATVGEGAPAWPLPEPLQDHSSTPTPHLALPAPWPECHDRDLVDPKRIRFLEGGDDLPGVVSPPTWIEAAALFLLARRRGARFQARKQRALQTAARESRRLLRLAAHLDQDLAGLPAAESLRRLGEALLASPPSVTAGAHELALSDPYDTGQTLRISIDPALSAPANADRYFAKARRIDRARAQLARRLADTRRELAEARAFEARIEGAQDLDELPPVRTREPRAGVTGGAPRHYLTSRGLSILVGRGARQNHQLTFSVARPEDLWLHAREAPGAHVILRDPEGRAGADDRREAAELAAFFSDAARESRVDVYCTRRKHVRPAKGGPGRVQVNHSESLRVTPRDPEGRLRSR